MLIHLHQVQGSVEESKSKEDVGMKQKIKEAKILQSVIYDL